ncbi:uncharacterized protein LOC121294480 [Polyodon spathula]|uniref:uncharacterized protein LOC121294480 n=1 Tax=Polyodon spathula TaxID=7913 RepID=UPI001B7F00BA|nr:uncharacterized protein LOC121294480 [Polyodon spathula]
MSARGSESPPGLPESESSQARAVLTAHAHSSIARSKEQTRDELEKIKRRVQHTVQAFELADNRPSLESLQQANMQFVEDMDHLEVIVGNQVNKKKYQQRVTVFIVGYQQLCGERKHILSQLNEFFIQNAKLGEEDSISTSEYLDIELDDVAMQVKDALTAAERTAVRLAEISQEIISYMSRTAIPNTQKRSRNKLDKAVNQAREDILQLTGKLLQTQADLEYKDERLKEMLKQNEAKFLESQYFRSQLETTKATLSSVQQELGLQISMREAEVRRQAARITELERELQEKGVNQGSNQEVQPPATQDSECVQPGTSTSEAAAMEGPRGQRGEGDPGCGVDIEDLKENSQLRITELQRGNMINVAELQEKLQGQQISQQDAQRELLDTERRQLEAVRQAHEAELRQLRDWQREQRRQLLGVEEFLFEELDFESDFSSSEESQPSITAELEREQQTLLDVDPQHNDNPTNEGAENSLLPEWSLQPEEETGQPPSEEGQEDHSEGTDSTGGSTRVSPSTEGTAVPKEPREEVVSDQALKPNSPETGATALDCKKEEASWGALPTEDRNAMFAVYRKEATIQVEALEAELEKLRQDSRQKTKKLKKLWKESKTKWDTERQVLSERQAAAQRDCEAARTELQRLTQKAPGDQSLLQSTGAQVKETLCGREQGGAAVERAVGVLGAPVSAPGPGGNLKEEGEVDTLSAGFRSIYFMVARFTETLKNTLFKDMNWFAEALETPELSLSGTDPLTAEQLQTALRSSDSQLNSTIAVFSRVLGADSCHSTLPAAEEENTGEAAGKVKGQDMGRAISEEHKPTESPHLHRFTPCTEGRLTAARSPLKLEPESPSDPRRPGEMIMFTHLDLEHNKRVLRHALRRGRVPAQLCQSACREMRMYSELQRQRLAGLVRQYTAYLGMMEVREAITTSNNSSAWHLLPRLQALHVQRLWRWSQHMAGLSELRVQLALSITDTLGSIEEESGIFLIKPVLLWKRQTSLKHSGRIVGRLKVSMKPDPSPTLAPSSQTTASRTQIMKSLSGTKAATTRANQDPVSTVTVLGGGGLRMWSVNDAEPGKPGTQKQERGILPAVPRLLEMDVNKFLISQHHVCMKKLERSSSLDPESASPRLSLRSFLPVDRTVPCSVGLAGKTQVLRESSRM